MNGALSGIITPANPQLDDIFNSDRRGSGITVDSPSAPAVKQKKPAGGHVQAVGSGRIIQGPVSHGLTSTVTWAIS
jgi:hypothetical protein